MQTLRLDIRGPTTWVWLDRPEVRNAFNAALLGELREVFEGLAPETRIVVLAGEGKVFSAGADVDWMQASVELSLEQNSEDASWLAKLFAVIDEAPQVVLARVHGAALGGAMGLLATSDIVVATEGTKLGLTEVRLGLIPAVISPYVVRRIGESAARRYFVTGEIFDATRGREIGLVDEVVAGGELDAQVERLCVAVLQGGPQAVREAKRLIREVRLREPEAAREYAVERIAQLRVSPEGQEGLAAFLGKRLPAWQSGGKA